MKFERSLYLKWLQCDDPRISLSNFKFVQICVLTAVSNKQIKGFTVFEPKDFSEQFLDRLTARSQREEFSDCQFTLYLPDFLKRRWETLSKQYKALKVDVTYTPFIHIKSSAGRLSLRTSMRIVNIDDSPVVLKFLKNAIEKIGCAEVVAQTSDPMQAVAIIQKHQPDLVTMDIQMPKKTGVELVQELLAEEYYPVIMISSLNLDDGSLVFEALNNGAFDYIQKPRLEDLELFKEELKQKALFSIEGKHAHSSIKKNASLAQTRSDVHYQWPQNLLWCLGASTGGTQALTRVLTNLPDQIPPTLIVQHIPPVFSKAFANSLNQLCPFLVKEAEQHELLKSNCVYVAPGGLQMSVEKYNGNLRIVLSDAPPVNRFKPSVDFLFASIAQLAGLKIVAAILTGMGRDGAEGLMLLKKIGSYTFAQNEESSAVYGMPRAAFEIGATDRLVHLDQIAIELLTHSSALAKAG